MWKLGLLSLLACGLSAQSSLVNADFEAGPLGSTPGGWSTWHSSSGLSLQATTVNNGCPQGRYCAMLKGPAAAPSGTFGILSQVVSATPFLSRTIRFRAAVRADGTFNSYARLWVRVDAANGTMLFNINSSNITSAANAYYQVDVPVASNAARINAGFLHFGSGWSWVDDTSLSILEENPSDPPSPLTADGLVNLTAFTKLLGYVRHFHPSDQAAQTDWNLFAIRGVRTIEGASTPEDLAARLQDYFAPVAPTVRVFAPPVRPELPADLRPASTEGLRMVRWSHFGVGLGQGGIYSSTRNYASASAAAKEGFIDPSLPYEAAVGRGVSALVPLSLYADAEGTLPHRPPAAATPLALSANDRATRLAGVMLAWNAIQHFYPYFDVVDTDWPAALTAALTSAATATGPAEYLSTLERLVAAQKDGHGYAWRTGDASPGLMVPLIWDWVEDQLIVTYRKSGQEGGTRGDRVLKIDGRPVEEAIAARRQLMSGATPQWVMWRTLSSIATCNGANMTIEIEPYAQPGTTRTAEFTCEANSLWREPRGATIQQLESGIYYVDINSLTDDVWQAWLPALAQAKGIVFDLRGYPIITTYLRHLSATPMTSAQWHIPTPSKPDRVDLTYFRDPAGEWTFMTPLQPYLGARRVFLTDGSAVSYAESEMGIVEHYRLAEIVGGPTAGTNGNINYNDLPGGFRLGFTGMKVLKHDGSQHHGIGIRPTIPAGRTRRGIAEGKDEVLARGIEIVKGPQDGPAPSISAAGIANAATFVAGPVAPGEMVTIMGKSLGPGKLVQTSYDGSGLLDTYAGGTRVFFDGVQAPLVHASDTQVTAVMPYGVTGSTKVRVEYQLRSSNEVTVPVAPSAPGIFSAIVNAGGSINSEANPATRGDIVTLFATGEGETTPRGFTGRLPRAGSWPVPQGGTSVTFGGESGEVLFKGAIAAGVMQVNVRVPRTAPAGAAVPLVLTVGERSSPAGRVVALK